MPFVVFNCKWCGKEKKSFLSPNKPQTYPAYCSRQCWGNAQSQWVAMACPVCGTSYRVSEKVRARGHGKYCSKSCCIADLRKRGALTHVTVYCLNCNNQIKTQQSQLKYMSFKYCSRKCMVEYWAKGHHPAWQDGRSKLQSYNASMLNRKRARKRAAAGSYTAIEWDALVESCEHKCVMCGKENVKLTVDHIAPLSKGGTNDISNLQPLCLSCNSKKNTKTIRFI